MLREKKINKYMSIKDQPKQMKNKRESSFHYQNNFTQIYRIVSLSYFDINMELHT